LTWIVRWQIASRRHTARFGAPAPSQKVFVLTCQVKNGWKAKDQVISAIAPPKSLPGDQFTPLAPQAPQVAATPSPPCQPALSASLSPALRTVYKGSTPDVLGMHKLAERVHPVSIPCASLVHGLRVAIGRLVTMGRLAATE
jgi:hypothetical protein